MHLNSSSRRKRKVEKLVNVWWRCETAERVTHASMSRRQLQIKTFWKRKKKVSALKTGSKAHWHPRCQEARDLLFIFSHSLISCQPSNHCQQMRQVEPLRTPPPIFFFFFFWRFRSWSVLRLGLCGIYVDHLAALGQTEITVGCVLHKQSSANAYLI